MKKILNLFLIIFLSLISINVKALCYDEELNEWAIGVNASFTEDTRLSEPGMDPAVVGERFAYFLSITPMRDDIIIKVTDRNGNSSYGEDYLLDLDNDGEFKNLYGVGCFTDLNEESYTIEVYGGEESACPNELLKTLKYTVPQYNEFIKTEYCDEYPDHELCESFTNKTKNMTEDEFKNILEKYDREIKEKELTTNKIFKKIIEYGIYILIPFIIISIYYIVKMVKYKKEERNK